MCIQNQNFFKIHFRFSQKKTHFTQNGISLYELILYSLVHHYQQFRTIPHLNIKEQDILVHVHDLYFFFYFDPSSQVFYFPYRLFSGGFYSPRACSRLFSDVSLPVDAPSNLWDPPLPFTPLLSTGQVDRPGLFECLFAFTMPVKYCNMESARNSSV